MNSGKESGFNLIEVMVTSLILAIGLLGIVALQGIAKKSLSHSDKQIEAAFHARTALAELRADTRWLSASSTASSSLNTHLLQILQPTISSAVASDLALCYNASGAKHTITVAVSWQKRDEASNSAQQHGEKCGQAVERRRQVVLTASISGDA